MSPHEMKWGELPWSPAQDKARWGLRQTQTAQLTPVLCMHLRLQVLGVDIFVGLILLWRAARPAAEEAAAAAAAAGESTAAQSQSLQRKGWQPHETI